MNLEYSPKGTPFISLENGAKLIFSKTTEKDKGFKYMCFSCDETKSITVSGAKAKNKKIAKIVEHVNFVIDMDFKRDKTKGIPTDAKRMFDTVTLTYLKKAFKDLTVDGFFPRESLPKLESKFKELDSPDDYLDFDPTVTDSFDDDEVIKPKKKVIKRIKKKSLRIKPKQMSM